MSSISIFHIVDYTNVSFSPETNTLKLSDATITYGATVLGIENDIPLTIELEGNNKITGSNAIITPYTQLRQLCYIKQREKKANHVL